MGKLIGRVVSSLVFFSTLSANAIPVFMQATDSQGGTASDLDYPNIVAEDFVLTSAVTLTSVDWYGGYNFLSIVPTATDDFSIAFYSDAGGQPTLSPFAIFDVGNAVNRTDTGTDYFFGGPEFSYTANVNVTLDALTTYYISIFNNTADDLTDWFWASSGVANTSSWLCTPTAAGACGLSSWTTNTVRAFAFTLNADAVSVPEPTTLSMLGAGLLVGLFGKRRRRVV